jgi:hypothetical protein
VQKETPALFCGQNFSNLMSLGEKGEIVYYPWRTSGALNVCTVLSEHISSFGLACTTAMVAEKVAIKKSRIFKKESCMSRSKC